ncbi:MAG: hypothetical protein GX363_10215 [Clostridiales bacterium]|nr:hypothetical protein [Clostridiales bacterium]
MNNKQKAFLVLFLSMLFLTVMLINFSISAEIAYSTVNSLNGYYYAAWYSEELRIISIITFILMVIGLIGFLFTMFTENVEKLDQNL